MKRKSFFNCYRIESAIKSGLEDFSKECGYHTKDSKRKPATSSSQQIEEISHVKPSTFGKLMIAFKSFLHLV